MPRKKQQQPVIKDPPIEDNLPITQSEEQDNNNNDGFIDPYTPETNIPFGENDSKIVTPIREEIAIQPPSIIEEPPLSESDLENMVSGGSGIDPSTIIEDTIETPIPDTSDPDFDNSIESPITQQSSEEILQELEEEKANTRRLSSLSFLKEYSKSTSRTVEEVARKLGMGLKTSKAFVNEYIQIVKDAVKTGEYPDYILSFYNSGVKNNDHKLKYYELDNLKNIVKRYSQYDVNANINKTLNSNGSDTLISNNSVAYQQTNPLSEFRGNGVPVDDYNTFTSEVPHYMEDSGEIKELRDGITSLQLIKFGLVNAFGQAAKMKISALLGPDPNSYLMDEQKFKNLLKMSGAPDTKATEFIEWLKTNSFFVAQPIGFLAFQPRYPGQRPPQGYGGGGGGGSQQYGRSGGVGGYGGAPSSYGGPAGQAGYDNAMIDYYYQTGAYLPGMPPDHPMNQQHFQKFMQQKREQEEMDMLTRYTDKIMRTQLIKTMTNMDGQGGNGSRNSLFSPEILLATGMGRYDRTGTDDQGNPVYGIVPNIGGSAPFGSGGQQGQVQLGPNGLPINPMDQTASTLGLVKEIMQTMTMMNNQQNGKNEDLFKMVIGGAVERMMNPPPQSNQIKDFVDTMGMFQKMNGGGSLFGQTGGAQPDPMFQIEAQRLANEKEFGLKALELKELDMKMKSESSKASEGDATQNMKWLLETLSGTAAPIVQTILGMVLGGRGGAAGIMPGGGGGGLEGLLGQGGAMMGPGGPMGGGPGGQPGGVNNAALNTIIQMEYENRNKQRKQDDVESRAMWKEHEVNRNKEWKQERDYQQAIREQQQREYQEGGYNQSQPVQQIQRPGPGPQGYNVPGQSAIPQYSQQQPGQQQYYEEEEVEISQPNNRPVSQSGQMSEEDINIDTFRPHDPSVIRSKVEEAKRHMQVYEKFIAMGEEAIAEKIANGDEVPEFVDRVQEEAKQIVQEQEQDINQYLDNFKSTTVEPDYTGPEGNGQSQKEKAKPLPTYGEQLPEEEAEVGAITGVSSYDDAQETDI